MTPEAKKSYNNVRRLRAKYKDLANRDMFGTKVIHDTWNEYQTALGYHREEYGVQGLAQKRSAAKVRTTYRYWQWCCKGNNATFEVTTKEHDYYQELRKKHLERFGYINPDPETTPSRPLRPEDESK